MKFSMGLTPIVRRLLERLIAQEQPKHEP